MPPSNEAPGAGLPGSSVRCRGVLVSEFAGCLFHALLANPFARSRVRWHAYGLLCRSSQNCAKAIKVIKAYEQAPRVDLENENLLNALTYISFQASLLNVNFQ